LLTLNARCGEGRGGKVCSLRCTSPPIHTCQQQNAGSLRRCCSSASAETLARVHLI
jgi:hypothetical protein